MALYRKYRPQNFTEVVGQDHIVTALKQASEATSPSHAYLFSGTRGLGKTSLARIFASELGIQAEDTYEIDGASNRKIEHVRQLREGVAGRPFVSPYKIYIIDEVHMLTKEAFNALLKTLEEPPQHVIFILATTEKHKVPDTIISRCQVHNFIQPTIPVLASLITRIAKQEKYTLEKEVAETLAIAGNGSFRDALGALEQVMSGVSGNTITLSDISTYAGVAPHALVHTLIKALAEENIEAVIETTHRIEQENLQVSFIVQSVIQKMRYILLSRFDAQARARIEKSVNAEEFAFIEQLRGKEGQYINARALSRMLSLVDQLRDGPMDPIMLELACIELVERKETSTSS